MNLRRAATTATLRHHSRLPALFISGFFAFGLGTSVPSNALGQLLFVQTEHAGYSTTRSVAKDCRAEGTSQYTSEDYALLMDMLAYDQGRAFMSIHIMTAKVLQLIQVVEYNSLKALFRTCAPQFVERSLGDIFPVKKRMWTGRLTRSEVIIYDESDNRQFSRDIVVRMTGVP